MTTTTSTLPVINTTIIDAMTSNKSNGGIFYGLYKTYRDYLKEHGDPRVENWFLMDSPLPTILMCLTYAYMVVKVGPKLMENRKPFNLRKILIYYNLFQVCFSIWLFWEASSAWLTGYSFKCQPVDYSLSPVALRIARASWWYYFSKFTEFFDTIFFVMRKKFDQVSTLHVLHHGIMPFSVWPGVRFTPGGHSTFFGFLNTFVHIIMYTYYLIASLGPQYQKYLWWKKYLTIIQMVQFVLILIHSSQLFFVDCDFPQAFAWWIAGHAVMFLVLFMKFYKKKYKHPKGTKAKIEDNNNKDEKQTTASTTGICFPGQNALYDYKHQKNE